jgi:magnesium transporter
MFYSQTTGVITGTTLSSMRLSLYGSSTVEVLQSNPFWLDVVDPNVEEMALLRNAFDIHPLTVEDIQAGDTRQKSDVVGNYTFIVIKSVDDKDYCNTLEPIQISIILFRECIITFQKVRNNHANAVIEKLMNFAPETITPDFLCYLILDDITNYFVPILRYLEREIDTIDELVLILKASDLLDMLQRISQARKKVMLLGRWINSKPDLVKVVSNRLKKPNLDLTLNMEDVYDCAITLKHDIAQYDATLARCHSLYLAQISIEITQASNRGNELSTKMTVLASILVPLNIITGLWGIAVLM